jgi:hypothetical protein
MTTMEIAFQTARPLRATEKIRDVKPETTLIEKIKSFMFRGERFAFDRFMLTKRELGIIYRRIIDKAGLFELAALILFWDTLPQVVR